MWGVPYRSGLGASSGKSARMTPSATTARIWPNFGVSRVGFTRLVSSTTTSSRVGSIQIEVPVNPVCPKLREDMNAPAEDAPDGVSQPMARDDPAG